VSGPVADATDWRMGRKNEKKVLVLVSMRVACGCGHVHAEDFEFDMPIDEAQPMEAYEPGTCPECRAPIRIHLRRTSALQ
jgi:hypothetical protein